MVGGRHTFSWPALGSDYIIAKVRFVEICTMIALH